jgi:nucleotide-binding universal stress UspA family protein
VDFGPNSQRTLDWAARFADDFHARLGVVHAVAGTDREAARQTMEQLTKSTAAAEIYIEAGEAAKTVVSLATSTGAELLVIGRAVHEDLTGRLRTTAYAIISQSPCPVVSV